MLTIDRPACPDCGKPMVKHSKRVRRSGVQQQWICNHCGRTTIKPAGK